MAKRAWMVRAGRDAILADQFEEKELVAIGFDFYDNLNSYDSIEAVRAALHEQSPEAKRMQIVIWAGQLWRLAKEIEPGDYLVTYLPASREYLIGQAADGYQYDPQAIDEYEGEYPHIRRVVSWRRADRDQLSQSARNTLGASLTLFNVTKLLPELLDVVEGRSTGFPIQQEEENEDETVFDYYEDVKARSDELIGDLLARLDGYEFEELTAALLRAMGYFVTQSAKGPDRGVDILAGPDPFHLEQPRIKVQVKKRESAADSNMIRSFIGILQSEDRGLFVSFGGYSKDARIEAERSNRPITLLDRLEFTRLLLEHYEKLEPEYQRQIPLKPVYLPTTTTE